MKLITAGFLITAILSSVIYNVQCTEIKVNIYPFHKDVTMKNNLPSKKMIKIFHLALGKLRMQISHSALQIGNEEWNFMGDEETMEPYWHTRPLPDEKLQTKSIFFCNSALIPGIIKNMVYQYLTENNYNVLTHNCNDASFEMANRICELSDPDFKRIKQPGICSRAAKVGSWIERKGWADFSGGSSTSASMAEQTGESSEIQD